MCGCSIGLQQGLGERTTERCREHYIPFTARRFLSGDFSGSLLGWSFPGRVKRMIVDQFFMCSEVVGFDGEILLIERLRACRGTEVCAIGFSLLFRGEPTESIFRHPG